MAKIAVVGCGAMGSVYAALMVDAGHEVHAVTLWPDHAEAMATKGLRLGQSLEDGGASELRFRATTQLSEQEQAVLGKSVSELNLSVRARKCMNRLGIATLGELVQRTADELLESKNFGMTSLNEVREKIGAFGLTLRGD